jgi:hypothetical protein
MGKTFSTGLLTDGISQDSSNNIGIGVAPSGTNKFEVSGSTKLNGNTAITGSLSVTAGITGSLQGTASFATTASYLTGYISPFPYTGSAVISGSLTVTGSLNTTGSLGVNGATTINLANTNYTNTGGTGSHLIINNPSTTGQNVISSLVNGSVVAKWRTDYVGNISWVAGGSGTHDFYTGGDFGTGTTKMSIKNNGNTQIGAAALNTTLVDNGFRLEVLGTMKVSGSTTITGSLNVLGSVTSTGTLTAQTLVVQTITSSVLYSSGSNVFGNSLSNTQVMTGSVGITGSLAVAGTGTFSGQINSTVGNNGALLSATTATTGYQYIDIITTSGRTQLIQESSVAGTTVTNSTAYASMFGSAVAKDLILFTNGAARITISGSNGNVGIGTTSSAAILRPLSIKPASDIPQLYLVQNNNDAGGWMMRAGLDGHYHLISYQGSESEKFTIRYDNGNVGIGTTSPDWLFKIEKNTASAGGGQYPAMVINNPNAAGYSAMYFFNNTTNCGGLEYSNASTNLLLNSFGALIFQTTSSIERMRITGAGNVGIGTTSPSASLHVQGVNATNRGQLSIQSSNASNAARATWYYDTTLQGEIGTTSGNFYALAVNTFLFYTGGSERMKISSDGNFDYGGYAVLSTNNATYRQAFYGGIAIMWRNAEDAYIDSNHTYGSSNTNVASYTSANGIGRFTFAGGNLTWDAYNGSVTAGTAYSMTNVFNISKAGYTYLGDGFNVTSHRINLKVAQGSTILVISGYSTAANDTAFFYSSDGTSPNGAATSMGVTRNSSTSRSINASGTINASGADYAEYMTKIVDDVINKGDIVGVNTNGKLTNIFNDAKSFVVKSTDPSYVGGDIWGNEDTIGKKPQQTTDQTDEEFAPIQAAFEAKLETARAKVDRISFSGQVPCNVTGATVGDYIIPIQLENGKIGGQAVTNPTFEQYQISVGKVWKIMGDGRAWIAVKIG